MPVSRRSRRTFWLLALVAFAAHAGALAGTFPGFLPSTGDTLGAFVPWHEFARQDLWSRGEIPLWNPHLFCGVPFLGNGQSALLYPPTYLHFLLPERFALWVFAFAHTLFFMLGGYFLGRTLGMRRCAAFLLAVLLGLGNATPAHLFGGHLTFLPARSFWPFQTAFLLRILAGTAKTGTAKSPRDSILFALCVALGLAAGAPQIWMFGILFCAAIFGFWAVKTAFSRRRNWRNTLWSLGFLLVLAALWCAPVLLPLRELRAWSSHGDLLSFEAVTQLSATPRSLFRLLFNGFFGGNSFVMWSLPSNPGEDAASIGFAPLLLAVFAPFFVPKSRVATALWFFCASVLVLALGNYTPLYRWLFGHFLLFQITRVPARWLEMWAFGAAILAAWGFDAMLRAPSRALKWRPLWLIATGACAALAIVVVSSKTPWRNGALIVARALRNVSIDSTAAILQREALISCVLAGAIGLALWVFWSAAFSRRRVAPILVLLLLEPLLGFWRSTQIAAPQNVLAAQIPAPISNQFQSGQRWIVRARFGQLNAPFGAGMDALNGYEPFGSAPFFDFARAAQPGAAFSADFQPDRMNSLWRVAGASHLLWKPRFVGDSPQNFPGAEVMNVQNWHLRRLEDGLKPWPRAYLTREIQSGEGEIGWEKLRQMAVRNWKNTPPALVPPDFSARLSGPVLSSETVALRFQTPDVRVYNIQTRRGALFVESETMAPGWKAWVDKKPAPLGLANAIFRGVLVPAHSQKIALIYNSQTLRFALFLSLCASAFAAFALSKTWPRRD